MSGYNAVWWIGAPRPRHTERCWRCATASDLDLEFGGQFLAFRYRPEEDGDDDQHQEADGDIIGSAKPIFWSTAS
jgi:hypothetical protein